MTCGAICEDKTTCERPEAWGTNRAEGHCKDHRIDECDNCGLEVVGFPDEPSVRCAYDTEDGLYCEACHFQNPHGAYEHDGETLAKMGHVEHIEENRREDGTFQ